MCSYIGKNVYGCKGFDSGLDFSLMNDGTYIGGRKFNLQYMLG